MRKQRQVCEVLNNMEYVAQIMDYGFTVGVADPEKKSVAVRTPEPGASSYVDFWDREPDVIATQMVNALKKVNGANTGG